MRGSRGNMIGIVCACCFVRVLNLTLPLRGKNMKGGLGMVTKGRDSCKCMKCKQNVQLPHIANIVFLKFEVHWSVHRKRIFNYNQQDATLYYLFISVKCCTCFRRFLRHSSGVQNCIYSIGYFVKPLLLPATVV